MPCPIVHRTGSHNARANCAQPDLALHLCLNSTPLACRHKNGSNWEPHVLFPELAPPLSSFVPLPLLSSVPQATPPALNASSTQPNKAPDAPRDNPNPQLPPRTTRIKVNRTSKKGSHLVDLDAHDFYEIPLQYAEGRELLTLIGAANVSIPPHLVAPQLPLPPLKKTGHLSKFKPKDNIPPGPSARQPKQKKDSSSSNLSAPTQLKAAQASKAPQAQLQVDPLHCPPGSVPSQSLMTQTAEDGKATDAPANDEDLYLDRVDYSEGDD